MNSYLMLLAAQGETTYHRFARLSAMTEGWQWLVMLLVCLLVAAYVVLMYRKDSVELSRGVAAGLVLLRLAALAGILFYFLDLEKGSQRRLVKNSRVAVLIDTSQSMGIRDYDESLGGLGPSRAQRVAEVFDNNEALARLKEQHDVTVYRFSDTSKPEQIASYIKPAPQSEESDQQQKTAENEALYRQVRFTAWIAIGLLAAALICGLIFIVGSLWRGRVAAAAERGSWSFLVALVLMISSLVVLAVAHLRYPELTLASIVGLEAPRLPTETEEDAGDTIDAANVEINWEEQLAPSGNETRLGEAIRAIVNEERGGPIAGIVVVTDGQGNAGISYSVATLAAQEAGIPVSAIGIGGDRPPINVRVVDLEAPQRVYPGDKFVLKGFVQAFGMEGKSLSVELYSNPADLPEGQEENFEEEKPLRIGSDGVPQAIEFESTPGAVGQRRYTLKVVAPEQDHDPNDNVRSANVEVVDRKNRVLLFAGGPTREYNFLRNLLFRDRDTTSDVLLQTGEPGISQEADEILFEFPSTASELYEYDCIVAFDPDWTKLQESQLRLLERWVSEQAGGLIVIAGPVHTPEWSGMRRGADPRIDIVKSLYPVVFASEGVASINVGRIGGETAWPLQFTRDGLSEKFLWLEDDGLRSEQIWSSFSGVYGYFAVRDVKSGARVYARFSDPQETSLDDEQPVYMAGHFYGAGRVFFEASGEMWRLRGIDDKYFETFYTKLIRWVSQGRLLRDSSRGVLLVDKQRCFLGDRVTVTAVLTDEQRRPLEVDQVMATLIQPDKTPVPITLTMLKESARAGEYQGQFPVMLEGDYRVELIPPTGQSDVVLTQEVRASSSLAETRQPLRNDAVLKEITERTRGVYYTELERAFGVAKSSAGKTPGNAAQQPPVLADVLTPQDQQSVLPGTPDRQFKQVLSTWLMALIAATLSLEWLVRRLNKLA